MYDIAYTKNAKEDIARLRRDEGQHKVPRLSNSRDHIDQLIAMNKTC